MTARCPACGRPNAAHRAKCLYCGSPMPGPAAPPPAAAKELPANLDQLVADALRGGRVDSLRSALEQIRQPPVVVSTLETATRAPAAETQSTPEAPAVESPGDTTEEATAGEAAPPAPVALEALFSQLQDQLTSASMAWRTGDHRNALTSLDALEALLSLARDRLLETLPPPAEAASGAAPTPAGSATGTVSPTVGSDISSATVEAAGTSIPWPPPVILPPYRHPFMLVIDGRTAGEGVALLAKALQIDVVTTRLHARQPYPTVVLRGPDREDLEQRAARVRRLTKIPVGVVARDELAAIAPPFAVVGQGAPGRLRIAKAPLWEMEVDPGAWPETEEIDAAGFILAVPGEVIIRRFREGLSQPKLTRLREARAHELAERRVNVIDLHGPERSIRFSSGATDFRGLPGYDAASSLRSVRGLIEQLPTWMPGIALVGRRVCTAPEGLPAFREGEKTERVELTGWSTWEEHTRLSWLFGRPGVE